MAERIEGYPLSPQQRRLWLLVGEAPDFSVQGSALIEGGPDTVTLRLAAQRLVDQHGILRTTYRRRPGIKVPLQVVAERGSFEWQEVISDAADPESWHGELAALAAAERARPFDLEAGPVLRLAVLELSLSRRVLVATLPALCADLASLEVLFRSLVEGVEAAEPVQYVEFALWENSLSEEEGSEEGLRKWRRPEIERAVWPVPRPFEREASMAGACAIDSISVVLGSEMEVRLTEVAQSCEVSPAVVLLAAWQCLLFRLVEKPELRVATRVDGRIDEAFLGSIGPFARSVPVVVRFDGDASFSQLIAQVTEAEEEARAWQEYYSWAVGEISASSLDAHLVGFEYADWPELKGSSCWLERRARYEPFALELACVRRSASLEAELRFDRRRFTLLRMRQLGDCFASLLRAALTDPELTVGRLPLVSAAEHHRQRLELNDTAVDSYAAATLHEIFERQVDRMPQAVAASFAERELSYAELDSRANRLAWHLLRLGVEREARVAICVMDPLEMIVALLGILKAGAAYLPLDPSHPAERLTFLLQDASVSILVSEERLLAELPVAGMKVVRVDADHAAIAAEKPHRPAVEVAPEQLAYVIYTSGSTGKPKGVMVPHYGLVNYLSWAVDHYRIDAGSGAPVHSPIGFDLTVTALFGPFLAGRAGRFMQVERGVEALLEDLSEPRGYSFVKLTPSQLEILKRSRRADAPAEFAQAVILGGEPLRYEALEPWRRHSDAMRWFNEYGPTEAVVGCAVYEVAQGASRRGAVPIGRPVANAEIHLFDRALRRLPAGSIGQLGIAGRCLASGYLGRPARTAERFIPHPEGNVPGARLYLSGDLARLSPDLQLEYLGRSDYQVKLRGFRIELGEIEAQIEAHPAVAACVAVVREDSPGDRRLVAYALPIPGEIPSSSALFEFLRRRLPDYMVPAALVLLDEFPLTVNGKIDRAALPPPDRKRPSLSVEFTPPQLELESQLADVWCRALQLEEVGIHDNFFDLGGNSAQMYQVRQGMLELAEQDISVMQMFKYPTIYSLAGYLAGRDGEPQSFAANEKRAAGRKASMSERRRQRSQRRTETRPSNGEA